jgi:methyltransferase-like protein
MKNQNHSKLLKLIELLKEETVKYLDGKCSEKKIILILGKINKVLLPPPKKGKRPFNVTNIKEVMDLVSKLIIIFCFFRSKLTTFSAQN